MLFHITTAAEWRDAQRAGVYRAASLDVEGFIHLSEAHQWRRSAARFFRGQRELALLSIDEARLADVRREPADGEHFPHLYGPLPIDAVVEVRALAVGDDGTVVEPSLS